jgi:site-specific recombinase XerD
MMSEDFENREEIIKLKGYLNSKNASEHTFKAYVKVAIEFLKFIRKDLHKVTQSEVYAFLGTIQHLSSNTKNVYAWALRNLFEANGISINVPIPQKSNWVEEEFKALSFDDILKLINSTPNLKYKAMLALMW